MPEIDDHEEADGDGEERDCGHPGGQAPHEAVDERQQAADQEPSGEQWLPRFSPDAGPQDHESRDERRNGDVAVVVVHRRLMGVDGCLPGRGVETHQRRQFRGWIEGGDAEANEEHDDDAQADRVEDAQGFFGHTPIMRRQSGRGGEARLPATNGVVQGGLSAYFLIS